MTYAKSPLSIVLKFGSVLILLSAVFFFVQCKKTHPNVFYQNYLGNDTVNYIMLSNFHSTEPYPVFQIRRMQFAKDPVISTNTYTSQLHPIISELRLVIDMYADFSLGYKGTVPLLNLDSIKSIFYGPDNSIYRQYIMLNIDQKLLGKSLFEVKHIRSNQIFNTITADPRRVNILLSVNYEDRPDKVIQAFNNFLKDSILTNTNYNYNPPF